MTLEAYAKVNLTLEVGDLRPDGYHDLRSVVAPISLFDVVELDPAGDIVDASGIDFGAENLAVRAACALRRAAGVEAGVRIAVDKRIPMGAGLGGGSADAAATLVGLDSLWGLGWGRERLMKVAEEVGSDVPALVLAQHYRGPVLMEGRGESVRLLDAGERGRLALSGLGDWMVLANPGVESATAEVYARCKPREKDPSCAFDASAAPVNDLQAAACALHPEIASALAALMVAGAKGAMMSGSGSTVFGFADCRAAAERIGASMSAIGCRVWLARSAADACAKRR